MTVQNQVKKVTVNGNDAASIFSFSPMVITVSTDLVVTHVDANNVETVLTEGTGAANYSVELVEFPATGSIKYPADTDLGTLLPTGESLVLQRVLPLEQQTDLENQGGYNAETQEQQFDKFTMIDLQQQEELDRSLRIPVSDTAVSLEIPNQATRANKYLTFDASGIPTATDAATASGTSVLATGSTTARLLADRFAHVYNVLDYGARGDGSTDDSAAIQAAIDAAGAAGGGTVYFPASIYAIETGLIVDSNNVFLRGDGTATDHANGKPNLRASAATTIKWTGTAGTGTMVKFTTDRTDTGIEIQKGGGGISDIFIDGQENALIGFEMTTWTYGRFTNLHIAWVRTYGYKLWTLANGVSSGGADDSQHNTFSNCVYSEINTAQNPVGMICGAETTAPGNFSMNHFENLRLGMDGTGNALEMEDTDTNCFYLLRCGNRLGGGTGKIILHADDTGTLSTGTTSRFNQFFFVECVDGIVAKATIAGTQSTFGNIVHGESLGNSATSISSEDGIAGVAGGDIQFIRTNTAANTYTGRASFNQLAASISRDDAAAGPTIFTVRESISPANDDLLGTKDFVGRNNANQSVTYARIGAQIGDVTDGAEDGTIYLAAMLAGTLTTYMEIGSITGGVRVGSNTFKGAGTLTADELYDDDATLGTA